MLFLLLPFSLSVHAEPTRISSRLDSLLLAAVHHTQASDYETSLKLYNQLLQLAEEHRATKYLILGNLNYGLMYYRIHEWEKALDYYYKALDLARKSDSKKYLYSIYNNIAIIYSKSNKKQKALEIFQNAIAINKALHQKRQLAINYINVSNLYVDMHNYKAAQHYLNQAEELFREIGDKESLSILYNNMGNLFLAEKKYPVAKKFYLRSLKSSDTANGFYYALVLLDMGKLYDRLQQYDSAVYFLSKSLDISGKIRHKENIERLYRLLAQIYVKKGEPQKAVGFYEKSLALQDSLMQKKSRRWVSEMQMKYEFGKKENQIENLRHQNKLIKLIWLISFLALLIIAFLLLYSYRTRNIKIRQRNELLRKEKEVARLELESAEADKKHLMEVMKANEEINKMKDSQFRQEIEHKDRELALEALHVVNKNEILSRIKEILNKTDLQHPEQAKRQIREISGLIKTNVHSDKQWDTFKLHFQKIHKNFFGRLQADYPSLSLTDLRMCAYFLVNLNTNEIAQISGISPASVRKRKQRLKEKLGLTHDAEIRDLLLRYR